MPGWEEESNHTGNYSSLDPLLAAYHYQTEGELKMLPFWGEDGILSGGGYVANLGSSDAEAVEAVEFWMENNWIDGNTRVLFVEFNVWNANTNLFNSITISFEFTSTGHIHVASDVEVIELYRYNGAGGMVTLLSEIILFIFVVVKTVLETIKIVKTRGAHAKQLANGAILFVIALYFIAFAVYIYRSVLTKQSVEEVFNNPGEKLVRVDSTGYFVHDVIKSLLQTQL